MNKDEEILQELERLNKNIEKLIENSRLVGDDYINDPMAIRDRNKFIDDLRILLEAIKSDLIGYLKKLTMYVIGLSLLMLISGTTGFFSVEDLISKIFGE